MIEMHPVFVGKIGSHVDTSKLVYKVFLGSVDPHFYFAGYIVPQDESYDFFYNPYTDNIANTDVIDMSDESRHAVRGVGYGEQVEIMISNKTVDGHGKMFPIKFAIDRKPAYVNTNAPSGVDEESVRSIAREETMPLSDAGLYGMRNTILVEVEAKLSAHAHIHSGTTPSAIALNVVRNMLTSRFLTLKFFPEELGDDRKRFINSMYMKIASIAPTSDSLPQIFADVHHLAKRIAEDDIDLSQIPYSVMFRLVHNYVGTKNQFTYERLKTAAKAVKKTEEIEFNMSSMEDVSKVYELLSKTQAFVYLTEASFENKQTGEVITVSLDNVFSDDYTKRTDECVEARGISAENGTVYFLYGYGIGCDSYGSIYFETRDGLSYGLNREDEIVGQEFVPVRSYMWGADIIKGIGSNITTTDTIVVTLKGV